MKYFRERVWRKRSKRVRGGEGREVTAAFCQDPVGHREDFGFYAE